ncbi:MAG: TIM barrel protein [Bacillota bacterium]
MEAVDSSKFSLCLDVGHAHINSNMLLERWVKGLNSKIRYVHLHNNDGKSDKHFGILRGKIDIENTLELLEKYAPDAKWSLETKSDETEESLLWLKQKGYIG